MGLPEMINLTLEDWNLQSRFIFSKLLNSPSCLIMRLWVAGKITKCYLKKNPWVYSSGCLQVRDCKFKQICGWTVCTAGVAPFVGRLDPGEGYQLFQPLSSLTIQWCR